MISTTFCTSLSLPNSPGKCFCTSLVATSYTLELRDRSRSYWNQYTVSETVFPPHSKLIGKLMKKNKNHIVHVQKISIHPHRRDWNFLGGGGFCKTQRFKEMCLALLEFHKGWGGGLRKNPFCGGGMDIFWNYKLTK